MQKGIIKWFNTEKGFGFIKLSDGESDLFVQEDLDREDRVRE